MDAHGQSTMRFRPPFWLQQILVRPRHGAPSIAADSRLERLVMMGDARYFGGVNTY